MPDNKKILTAKADAIGPNRTVDTGLLTLAAVIVIAGIGAYYLVPALAGAARALIVIGSLVVAAAVTWFTRPGRAVREYLRETQFEMRKVVWPTREETLRTSLVVVAVTILIAIVLGLIDVILKSVILDWLLKL